MKNKTSHMPALPFDRPSWRYITAFFKITFCLATTVLIIESLIPAAQSAVPSHTDKLLHFAAYFLLGFLACFAFPRLKLFSLIATLFALGGVLEIAQNVMDFGRTGSWGDQLANTAGIVAPVLLWIIAVFAFKRRD